MDSPADQDLGILGGLDNQDLGSKDGPRDKGGRFSIPRWKGTFGASGGRRVFLIPFEALKSVRVDSDSEFTPGVVLLFDLFGMSILAFPVQ